MGLRFLVVEGNTRDARQTHRSAYGLMPSESYAAVLQAIAPDALCDLAFPADEGANLPQAEGLESYDGIVLTGSHLSIYDRTPDILRQIDLMRAIYQSGTPSFGSCWGLQVAAVAADGDVQRNLRGREVGFARRLLRTEAGRLHPMLDGRPEVYDAPAIHCVVLSSNDLSAVQAADIRFAGGAFWGVQYHPEFSLGELAVILDRRKALLVGEGFCRTPEDAAAYVEDLATLHVDRDRADLAWRHGIDMEVLQFERRTREIANFVAHRVRPGKSARGRA
jgi:GMP synthase (glutamine-hydrolysing)